MIRAGHERARRNLPDTWALRRSRPLVSLDPSGLRATIGGTADAGQRVRPPDPPIVAWVIHRPSTIGRTHPVDRPVAGSSALRCPSKPVRTSRPPTSSAAVTTSEWATRQATVPSGSMANVSSSDWTRTWARRDDAEQPDQRRRRAVLPANIPAGHLEPERVEAVGDDEQAGRIPVDRAWGIVDERRKAGGPGATRTFEPQLGAAQHVGLGATRSPRSTRVPPASVSAKTAGPEPLPPHRQRARRPPG